MNPSNYCYFNGALVRYEDIHLHVSDLLLQRGYGVFDFFRIRNGIIPWLADYTDRLYNSLTLSEIDIDLEPEQFSELISKLQEKNNMSEGAFKVIVTGGYSENLHGVTGPANVIILNVDWKKPPEKTFLEGVGLITEEFIRPNPEIKTLYYFNTLRLRKKLQTFDAADVLFYSDTISEASRSNLFFVKNGMVFTPARNILKGVTRKQVLAMFGEIRVEDVGIDQVYEFDEIFMTGTSRDITPVVFVEGRSIGKGMPGPVTREVQESFRKMGW
jgi:branched-subunit amino acid aminotransferase/4-amino-4-deoxychorismate lyase